MNQIDAIYQNGVFKPLGDTGLRENERGKNRWPGLFFATACLRKKFCHEDLRN